MGVLTTTVATRVGRRVKNAEAEDMELEDEAEAEAEESEQEIEEEEQEQEPEPAPRRQSSSSKPSSNNRQMKQHPVQALAQQDLLFTPRALAPTAEVDGYFINPRVVRPDAEKVFLVLPGDIVNLFEVSFEVGPTSVLIKLTNLGYRFRFFFFTFCVVLFNSL